MVRRSLKTEARIQDIDIDPTLTEMLRTFIGEQKSGPLFRSRNWHASRAREHQEPRASPAA